VYRLRECLVGTGQENQDLGVRVKQILLTHTPHRAAWVDRMDDGPTKRKKHDTSSLQIQVVKLSHRLLTRSFDFSENDLDLYFDELAAPCICDSEFQCSLVSVRSNDRVTAVKNSCGGPRESGKDYASSECDTDDVDQRLDSYECVCWDSYRNDVAISDRCERVYAEKKRTVKWMSRKTSGAGLKCILSADQECQSEKSIDRHV